MADNVFGSPITNDTLKAMDKYMNKPTITRLDRAHEALASIHDGSKASDARRYVDRLKADYGDGVSTLCLFYNATGDPVRYIVLHDWHGHLERAPIPQEIGNGQWGGFLHVKPAWPNIHVEGSSAGVVYRGMNDAGQEYDWMCSWNTPWTPGSDCKAYTMIREVGHFVTGDEWNALKDLTDAAALSGSDEWEGCVANVSIGNATTAAYEAILSLKGAENPNN